MNIIVSNKQKEIIDNANIDAIKDLNGLFNVDDLIEKLKNYFFSKLILDATSVVSFAMPEVLEKLAKGIGVDRLVILLPASPEPPQEFIERLINLKIYNFSNRIDDIVRFINTPNSYNDVKPLSSSNDNFYVDNSVREDTSINTNDSIVVNQSSYTDDELNVDDDDNNVGENLNGINNNNVVLGNNVRTDNNNSMFLNSFNPNQNKQGKLIIGIRNITEHAGSTTLTYLLTKMAMQKYNKRVLAIEVNKNDFGYFQNANMISADEGQLKNVIESKDVDVIFIDLNNYQDFSVCNDVINLVEPSIIKLNKLMMKNRNTFKELNGQKVVLNKSLLSENDVNIFAKEAGMPMFYNLRPLNDRIVNNEIIGLLNILGIN